ncbi:MAG: hypothetical protein ACE5G0_15965 [Rhodothermales bacterium]
MDILKYFYEEPALLEALPPDLDPDARRRAGSAPSLETWLRGPHYYRGYLAGSNLDDHRVGATAIARPDAFAEPVLDWLAGRCWMLRDQTGSVEVVDDTHAGHLLRKPNGIEALVCAAAPLPEAVVTSVIGQDRRYSVPALRCLLDEAHVAFFPEPAHHGYDWSFFSARPMQKALVAAFRRHLRADVRYFALPYQKARSEARFYFEVHDLSAYAAYEVG